MNFQVLMDMWHKFKGSRKLLPGQLDSHSFFFMLCSAVQRREKAATDYLPHHVTPGSPTPLIQVVYVTRCRAVVLR